MSRTVPRSVLITFIIGALAGCGQGDAAPSVAVTRAPTVAPSPTKAPARLWAIRRGEAKSDQLWGVDVDPEGNVYATGTFQSPASAASVDIVTWKFAPDGQELWRSQWGKEFEEKAFVVVVAGGRVLVGGEQRASVSPSDSRMLLLALDAADGHVTWEWTWGSGVGDHEVDGIVVDGDAVYVSGSAGSPKAGGEIAIAKLGLADGREGWVRTWGGPKADEAHGSLVLDDRFLYVTGRYGGDGGAGGKVLVAKFAKASGDYVRHVTLGDGPMSVGLGAASDGTSLFVAGFTTPNLNNDILLTKLDPSLRVLWERTWGGQAGDSGAAVAVARSGDILVAGHSASRGSGSSDIVLLKFTQAGSLAWEQVWGGPLEDLARGLAVDGDIAYLAGETANGAAGQNDGLLLRVNALLGQMPPR